MQRNTVARACRSSWCTAACLRQPDGVAPCPAWLLLPAAQHTPTWFTGVLQAWQLLPAALSGAPHAGPSATTACKAKPFTLPSAACRSEQMASSSAGQPPACSSRQRAPDWPTSSSAGPGGITSCRAGRTWRGSCGRPRLSARRVSGSAGLSRPWPASNATSRVGGLPRSSHARHLARSLRLESLQPGVPCLAQWTQAHCSLVFGARTSMCFGCSILLSSMHTAPDTTSAQTRL